MSIQELAGRIHANQLYGNQPYTYHLQHVVNYTRFSKSEPLAWLHDSLEDHPECMSLLTSQVSTELLHQIQTITHNSDETYFDYIRRVAACGIPEVIDVKIADVKSNLSENPAPSLAERYIKALAILERVNL